MLSRKSKARAGVETARALAEDPAVRAAAADAAQPMAKLGLNVTRRIARRRVKRRLHHLADTVSATTELASTYGPEIVRNLGVLGLVEAPKQRRRRTMPKLAAGVALGASTMYLLEPSHGREHRAQLQRLLAH